MMPQMNPQFSAMDQSDHDSTVGHCQVDCSTEVVVGGRKRADPGQRNGGTASSSPDSGSLNRDGKRSGKSRRRQKRAPNSEREQEGDHPSQETSRSPDPCTALLGLQAECSSVWFQRSVFEQAESLYQCSLAHSSNGTTRPSRSPPPPENPTTQPPASPSPPPPACSHAEQVSCRHMVQAVWVNKPTFDQAEQHFVEASLPPSIPNSLDLVSNCPATPDEGYLSLAPTPATPPQHAATTPTTRQSINGLPRIPVELLRDVWLEKPLYDRAEAAFYQNLYGNNSKPRANNCPSTSRSTEHPQSLVEEEEEDEEDVEEDVPPTAVEERPVVPQGKAEVFHALHPIQEEEEPADITEEEEDESAGGVCHFLHPDSERVWLDRWRYEVAESRFHGLRAREEAEGPRGPDTGASTVGSTTPQRDKTMSALDFLAQENIWFDKPRYDEAERRFYECTNGPSEPSQASTTLSVSSLCLSDEGALANTDVGANSILQDIARARENIQKSLAGLKTSLCIRGPPLSHQSQLSTGSATGDQGELVSRIKSLELENQNLHKVWLVVEDLRSALSKLESRVAVLEKSPGTPAPAAAPSPTPAPAPTTPCTNGTPAQELQQQTSAPAEEEDEDGFDLFGSGDEEDAEAERIKEQRVKEYAERKAKKPALIAKSSILLDVKPWDDETDMVKLEECVRSIEADGLLWGTSKLLPVGYGINKLQIACVVEDDKVGTDMLEEEITSFEDYVQSVDVAAFNKI